MKRCELCDREAKLVRVKIYDVCDECAKIIPEHP